MVEANVKIIEELRSFLQIAAQDPAIRKLVTQSETDFSRDRKLTFHRLVGLLMNLPKRSLCIEIQEFFDSLAAGPQACSKTAFCNRRAKLKPLFFQVWNQWLIRHFYMHYGSQARRWKGFLLQAVDGSTAYLPQLPSIVAHFGTQANQHTEIAMARVLQIQDVLNDLIVWGDIYPISQSEPSIVAAELERLPVDSVTLFDRGFAGFALMYLMQHQESPRHFVIRCKLSHCKAVEDFRRSGKKSKILELSPSYQAVAMLREYGYIVTAKTMLRVRAIQVNLPNGEQEILLSNLLDEQLYGVEELKQLYGLRWGIETSYGRQKNQLQLEQFSGQRVICIQQDYTAALLVANLQRLIEKQCSTYLALLSERRANTYQINGNASWACLKNRLVQLFVTDRTLTLLLALQAAFERNIEPLRPGRKYERTTKTRRLKGKYQTFTNYKRAV